jgi:hypothetical protein
MKDSCLWDLEKKWVTGSYGPTWRTLVLQSAGTSYDRLKYVLPGVHLYSGLLEQILVGVGWPSWRTLEFWTAGTDSGKRGLAYLAYTCTLVCWNRFWQKGADLPDVPLILDCWNRFWQGGGLACLAYTCTLVC